MTSPPRPNTVVLIVEDDRTARELFRQVLTLAEFSVVDVEDGVSALQYLDTHQPAAVVLDLALPRLHGRDVIKELGAHNTSVPIVVVTGTDEHVEDRCVSSVLRKPVTADALVAAVRRGIRSHRTVEPTW